MNQETAQLLQQIGIEKSDLSWTTQVVLILAILLVSYLTTLIFRHLIMPAVRKITARTKATWDDYLFNDKMMKASCRMIPPITWYILLPFAFDDKSAYLLQILLKICLIYLIITALMLIKCFLDSLYEISSEHEALKNRPLAQTHQSPRIIEGISWRPKPKSARARSPAPCCSTRSPSRFRSTCTRPWASRACRGRSSSPRKAMRSR